MMNVGDYHYHALPTTRHIRLASLGCLKNKGRTDLLTCELRAFPLDEAPPYYTLSYTWGPPQLDLSILVDHTGSLSIRENLAIWLRECGAKYGSNGMLFWIDMLCIDQTNIPERNAQVQMIRDIYRRAERLYVWLGGDDDAYSQAAMDTLEKVGSFLQHFYEDTKLHVPVTVEDMRALGMPNVSECNWPAFCRMLQRPWFERVWVQQEIVMSDARQATLQCGGRELPWTWLEHTLFAVQHYYYHLPNSVAERILRDILTPLSTVRKPRVIDVLSRIGKFRPSNSHQPSPSVEVALRCYRGLKATDARDNVFALLGLAGDADSIPLKVDYGQSVEDVYCAVTGYLVRHHRLDLLSEAGMSIRSLKTLPTWAIDWTHMFDFIALTDAIHVPYRASGTTSAAIIRIEGDLLHLFGIIIDEVSSTTCSYQPEETQLHNGYACLFGYVNWMKEAKHLLELMSIDLTDGCVWNTVIAGMTFACYPADSSLRDGFMQMVAYYKMWEDVDCDPSRELEIPNARELNNTYYGSDDQSFVRAFCLRVMGRCFGVTKKGRTALLPDSTEPGDVVTLLQGARAAYILRPARDGKYHLVGQAYVHGVMYGEAWPENKNDIKEIVLT